MAAGGYSRIAGGTGRRGARGSARQITGSVAGDAPRSVSGKLVLYPGPSPAGSGAWHRRDRRRVAARPVRYRGGWAPSKVAVTIPPVVSLTGSSLERPPSVLPRCRFGCRRPAVSALGGFAPVGPGQLHARAGTEQLHDQGVPDFDLHLSRQLGGLCRRVFDVTLIALAARISAITTSILAPGSNAASGGGAWITVARGRAAGWAGGGVWVCGGSTVLMYPHGRCVDGG